RLRGLRQAGVAVLSSNKEHARAAPSRSSILKPEGVFMTRWTSSRPKWLALVITMVAATTALAQATPPVEQPGQEKAPERTPTKEQPAQPAPAEPRVVTVGPTREVKLAEYTWFRLGFQVQAWYRAAQDRAVV